MKWIVFLLLILGACTVNKYYIFDEEDLSVWALEELAEEEEDEN